MYVSLCEVRWCCTDIAAVVVLLPILHRCCCTTRVGAFESQRKCELEPSSLCVQDGTPTGAHTRTDTAAPLAASCVMKMRL